MTQPLPLSRRALPGLLALGLAGPAGGRPALAQQVGAQQVGAQPVGAQPGAYRWRISRKGSDIGSHDVVFSRADGLLTARSTVAIQVKILGITVFRFSHQQEEVWQGEQLLRASGRQDRNGRVEEMAARFEAGAMLVQGTSGAHRLAANAAPFAWWDPRRPTRPLFDGADGRPMALRWSRGAVPDGGALWTVAGEEDGDVGYAPDGSWRSLLVRGEDGSEVRYVAA